MSKQQRKILLMCATLAVPTIVAAQNTVYFSTSDAGVTKSVAEWGVDTAWPSYDNVRLSVANIGQSNVDVVRVTFHPGQALIANPDGTYSLNATARGYMDTQLNLAAMAGTGKPITFVPGEFGSTYDAVNWVRTIKATQEYINSKTGWTSAPIKSIEVFNEPDYWVGQGNGNDWNAAITQLKTYAAFQNTEFPAASTLNSDNAQWWYQGISQATHGSSHLLGGSLTSYVNFIESVKNSGKTFINPELHSLGEAIVGAEHGMVSGTWWADVLRARGLFIQASDGKRLGYSEDLGRQSAAAVYRANDGKIYAFAGGLERFGWRTAYRFVSTDKDVYFNGIPTREYVLQTKKDEYTETDSDFSKYGSWSNQGAYADIETAPGGMPALDGFRWKIVNVSTGQVMEVSSSGTNDGALIRNATDAGALNQKWDIVRTRNGYVHLFNANSGKTAEVANLSLNNGASVRQWGTADNAGQQWYVEPASDGTFYIRNTFSTKYLTGNSSNNYQTNVINGAGGSIQKWRFVLANPTSPAKARYPFQGNASDSAGTFHATATGNPTYGTGPDGQAITLDGVDDYVTLPSGVAGSNDITISANVKWNGGNSWQRIFDFGNGTTSYMFLTPKSGSNTMRFGITSAGMVGEEILETDPLPIGQWVRLTLTLGGNTGVLYINGKPRVAGQILINPSDVAPTLNYIGKSQWADPLFSGMIDDFRVYDYALHMSQVAGLVYRRWTGSVNSNWTTTTLANPKNWEFDVAATDYANGNAILFDDWATNNTVNITDATVTPGSVLFDNSLNHYTLNGPGAIAGSAALTKNGSGALTITNSNTYSGGTNVSGGTLNINNASAIGTGTLTLAAGAAINNTSGSAITLSTNNPQTWNGDFAFGGSNPLNMGSGAVTLTGDRTVTINGSGALTVATIGQSGAARSLTKAGPGTLVISGVHGYTGSTNITGGTLSVAGNLSTSPNASVSGGTLIIPAGGTLNNSTTTITSGSAVIGGNSTTSGDFWVGYGSGGAGTLAVQTGGIVNANVLLVGAGASPTNLVTGSATIAAGSTVNTTRFFVVGHSGVAGSSAAVTIDGTVNVRTSGTEGTLELGTWDSISSSLNVNTGSVVRLQNNSSVVFGAWSHNGAATLNHHGGAVTFHSDGGVSVGGTGDVILGQNGTGTYTYNLNGGMLSTGSVTRVSGTGILNLNGGTLKAARNGAHLISNLSALNIKAGGAVIDSNGNNISIAQAMLHDAAGPATDGGLTKLGSGTLTLSGANTYTGVTTIQDGALILSGSGAQAPVLAGPRHADIQSGKLIFGYSGNPALPATLQTILTNGYASGFSTGSIRSSTASAALGLGWRDDAGSALFAVASTLYGDANLDLSVNSTDFVALAAHYGGTGKVWEQGDFNYDGRVSTADFNLLAGNFGDTHATSLPGAALGANVPEPGMLGTLSLGMLAAKRRREITPRKRRGQ